MKNLARSVLSRAAGKYAAGETLEDAISVAKEAKNRGYGSTICYWHAALEEPRRVFERYLKTLERITEEELDARLALKVPGLWERQELIDEVVGRARDLNIHVEIDSHEPEKADDVVRAAEALGPENLTVAIPARWTRSLEMAEWAIEQGLAVRVVKGSWADPAMPHINPDEGYRALISALAGRCHEVAVASHDPELAEHSLEVLSKAGTPALQELVYGLPMNEAAEVANRAGVSTRVYIPYGHAWVPYAISRALREPKTLWWLASDLFSGDREALPPKREAPALADIPKRAKLE